MVVDLVHYAQRCKISWHMQGQLIIPWSVPYCLFRLSVSSDRNSKVDLIIISPHCCVLGTERERLDYQNLDTPITY